MPKQPSNCSLKCHLSVRATVPINLGSLGCFFFFAPLVCPPPPNSCVILQYLRRNGTDKKSFSSSSSQQPPTPTLIRFFFLLRLEQFGSVLGAFLWPILFQSPVWDPGRWTQRTQAHIQPWHGVAGGVAGGGRKTNRIYLGRLRHQLNTWAERQRLFRKSPGRQGDPLPLPPGLQKITGAENKALA